MDMMQERWYDVAEICCTGHVVNGASIAYPELGAPFCSLCGAPTIRACPWCGAAIPGEYHLSASVTSSSVTAPAYCAHCGAAFPWTTARIEAAYELAEEIDLLTPAE